MTFLQYGLRSSAPAMLALILAGCSGDKPYGTLSGTVTYQGKPVAQAEVQIFHPESGVGATATITDGKFDISDKLNVGEYQVAVVPYVLPPDPDRPATPAVNQVPIPRKARDTKSSGLTVTIKAGANQTELALQD